MFGATTSYTNANGPYSITIGGWPGQSQYGSTDPWIIVYRDGGTRTNDNRGTIREELDKFSKLVENVTARRRRISREQKRVATSRLRRFGMPPLAEAMFEKPTFVRRACGSRWRVMTP